MERSHATVDSRSGKFETLEAAIPAKVAGRVKALVATMPTSPGQTSLSRGLHRRGLQHE